MTEEELIQYATKVRAEYKAPESVEQAMRESVERILSNKNVYDAMKRLSEM
ncbi:hypothetical protein OIT44_02420 [Weissella ceti]|uniref:Uncharacterized protein n=1 Tax=Weissella ceti TaxID=759620 RepID=A0ABT3E3C8_9LACO|nr:hypothetical protein [Weissella ceti]MCW0952925.1 hypothetical protein [Weissella ceti]QVK11472.1 hypothetical protein KHQ31_04435 [Weissella ceti]